MVDRSGGKLEADVSSVTSYVRQTDISLQDVFPVLTGPRVAWLPPDGPSIVAGGATVTLTASGSDRFETIQESAQEVFDGMENDDHPVVARPRLFGGFAFYNDHVPESLWEGFPGAWFILPRIQFLQTDDRTWLTVTGLDKSEELAEIATAVETRIAAGPHDDPNKGGVSDCHRVPSDTDWRQQVELAIEEIEAGALEKVVVPQALTCELNEPVALSNMLFRLTAAYPECVGFGIDPGGGRVFFGATPEQLVTRRGSRVTTEALAGSTARGDSTVADDRLANELTADSKLQREHALVVDTIRSRLRDIAATVHVDEVSVRRLTNVHHLETSMTADLDAPIHILKLVKLLHPTPAVGGFPPDAARELSKRTDQFFRGWYAGPIGWMDASGDGSFIVGIRSAITSGSRATLFAGNGIVAGSDPDDEWDELQLKYEPILGQMR